MLFENSFVIDFLSTSLYLYPPLVYNRLLFENEVTHLVSIYRFSPNFYRVFFFWLTFFYAFQNEKRKGICYFYVFWRMEKYCWTSTWLNRHWLCLLETKQISLELNLRESSTWHFLYQNLQDFENSSPWISGGSCWD